MDARSLPNVEGVRVIFINALVFYRRLGQVEESDYALRI
jgi:hypothetical protein